LGRSLGGSRITEDNVDLGPTSITRRQFTRRVGGLAVAGAGVVEYACAGLFQTSTNQFAEELGVTTGSFMRHLTEQPREGKLRLLDLPRILKNHLHMRVIDLMTATLPSLKRDYLVQLRDAARDAGCVLTNLKMNQPGLNLGSEELGERDKALDEYKRTIEGAAILGVQWVRPLPGPQRPNRKTLAAAYRELIEFAKSHQISLLLENYGWMMDDPDAIPDLIREVGPGLAAQPDTGNWSNNDVRYTGLARAFPLAVSCDFKAHALSENGEHEAYDLKRCFDIGWDAGFRGPWCFEHFHDNLDGLYRGLAILRDRLREWMKVRSGK